MRPPYAFVVQTSWSINVTKTRKNLYYGAFLTYIYWTYTTVVFSLKKHKIPRNFFASVSK
jgi:hypothetical protein